MQPSAQPLSRRRFAQLLDDGPRRGVGWIPHAQIDDVYLLLTLLVFQRVNPREQIRRKPGDAL